MIQLLFKGIFSLEMFVSTGNIISKLGPKRDEVTGGMENIT
jgi:hypothetical protein